MCACSTASMVFVNFAMKLILIILFCGNCSRLPTDLFTEINKEEQYCKCGNTNALNSVELKIMFRIKDLLLLPFLYYICKLM